MSTQDARAAADDFLEALEADVPVLVEADVSAAQLVRGLRAAGLSMRFDDLSKGMRIIVSRAQGRHRVN
jgi:hypothetical protein